MGQLKNKMIHNGEEGAYVAAAAAAVTRKTYSTSERAAE